MYNVSKTCQITDLNSIYVDYFGYPSKGFFVEVGAFDGESFSNTSCLADHGWKGIYIEPIELHYNACMNRHKHNDVNVVQCSIGVEEGEIDIFVGGPLTTSDPEQVKRYSEIDWAKHIPFSRGKCEQMKLDSLLEHFKVNQGFDILGVDVEGKEHDVFNSFTLEKWKPKMMIVELEDEHESFQKYKDHVEVHKLLRDKIHSQGYLEIYKDHINTIFVSEDFKK
jgi:FkbM family methyltransferase